MNYELAKELKDAGFPQYGSGEYICEDKCDHEEHVIGNHGIYAPTLEDLIDACGELQYLKHFRYGPCWMAAAYSRTKEMGDTAEEAVARLWLALNKPSTPLSETQKGV